MNDIMGIRMNRATRITMAQLVALLVALVIAAPARAQTCPEVCTCKDDSGEITADCSNKNLTEIPNGFDEFTVELKFSGNNLTTIDETTFANFTQLRKVDISNCKIQSISPGAFSPIAATLERLIIERNLLTEISEGVFSQLQLNQLILSENHELEEIAEGAFTGSTVERLDLNRCNLTTLQNATLEALKGSLQQLSLSHNGKIFTLPAKAFQGFTLESCVMENNSLSSLDFLSGSTIRALEVNHNALGDVVFGVFEYVDGIEELYAANTDITHINITITANQSVYVIDVSNNKIATLDPEQFKYFPSLVTLDIAGNMISTIPTELHDFLPSLTYADFSNNRIKVINTAAFQGLPIKLLDFNGNQIQTVPESFKPVLVNTDTFKIERNPLHCNCEMLWFSQWIKSLRPDGTAVHVENCVTPENKALLDLRDMEFRCTAPLVLFVAPDSIEPGKRVSLHCKAKGDPPPEIRITSSVSDLNLTAESHPNRTLQQNELVYHIEKFSCEVNFGDYQCIASNVAGEAMEEVSLNASSVPQGVSCTLTPTDAPPTPTTPTNPGGTPDSGEAKDDGPGSDTTGYIVAIVVCVVLLLVILVIVAYCYWQRKTSQTYKLENQNGEAKVHYTNEGADIADTV